MLNSQTNLLLLTWKDFPSIQNMRKNAWLYSTHDLAHFELIYFESFPICQYHRAENPVNPIIEGLEWHFLKVCIIAWGDDGTHAQ